MATRSSRRAMVVLVAGAAMVAMGVGATVLWARGSRAALLEGVRTLTVASAALARAMPVQAWVPAGTADDARLPVIVLLHGAGGDEATWFGGTLLGGGLDAQAVAARLSADGRIPPVVLVAPSIDDSYGVDSPPAEDRWEHGAYETYLRDELLPGLPS